MHHHLPHGVEVGVLVAREWSEQERGAVTFEHHECGVLIREPTERGKRDEAVRTDKHKPSQPVPNSREPSLSTIPCDTVLNRQMSAFNLDADSVAEYG